MPDPSRLPPPDAAETTDSRVDESVLRLDTANGPLAYRRSGTPPSTSLRLVFCPGYRSTMDGIKARTLSAEAVRLGLAAVCFDYRGHGRSPGAFERLGIGDWLADLEAVLAGPAAGGPAILVGASMGAWLAVLAAERNPAVAGLVTLGAAPDFTEELLRPGLTPAEARSLDTGGMIHRPSRHGDGP
ncbi:MAG: alpha/beta hydrolase [Azospirillaceae bacterium]